MTRRGPLTQWASILLVAAVATAAIITLATGYDGPTLAVTRTTSSSPTTPVTSKLTIDATFHGLAPGQVASATVTVDGTIAATAAFGPAPDGTATRTLTLDQIPVNTVAVVDARGGNAACTATVKPAQSAKITCPAP